MKMFFLIMVCATFLSLEASPSSKKKACLNMIVRNESASIALCLESVKPFIDSWIIVDAGSTDNTKEMVREMLKDIPGELYDWSWINCGQNREEALQLTLASNGNIVFMDGWDEDVFWSKLKVMEDQDFPNSEGNEPINRDFINPEPLYYLAQVARIQNDFEKAYTLLTYALNAPFQHHVKCSENWINDYGLLFEFAIASYWVGEHKESLSACDILLAMEELPVEFRQFTEYNRTFSLAMVNQ